MVESPHTGLGDVQDWPSKLVWAVPSTAMQGGCTEQERMQCFSFDSSWGPDRCIVAPSLSMWVGLLVLESSLGGAVYTYISDWNILHKKSMLLRIATKPMLLTQKAPLPSEGRKAEAESAPRGSWRHPLSDFPACFSRAYPGSASSACLLGTSDAVKS